MSTSPRPQFKPRHRVMRWLAVAVATVVTVGACTAGGASLDNIALPDGEMDFDQLVEICETLQAADASDTSEEFTFDELIEAYRLLCAQIDVPLASGTNGDGGAAGGANDGRSGSNDANDSDSQTDADRNNSQTSFDDADQIRRAIAAGPQCNPADYDLSMSEVMKAPAVGPMGSPDFDAALAQSQYRAPGHCLAEPYRTQWFLVADAYTPVFTLLEAYATASNQGFEALVALGEQLGQFEEQLEHLQSDEVQQAIVSTDRFFAELERSGRWDSYKTTHAWENWWANQTIWDMWAAGEALTGHPIGRPPLPQ